MPELLDHLSPTDPLAERSRLDLQRIHRAMRSVSILRRAVSKSHLTASPRRILELGAGDGTLLLRFARSSQPRWTGVELTLLDRHDLMSTSTRRAFEQLDWRVTVISADALEWTRRPLPQRYDLCVATLFLHHFDGADLENLLTGVAARTDVLIACEPRRSAIARIGSRLVGLLGANEVTREDAVTSVAAGFAGSELTQAWSQVGGYWLVNEYGAWPFSHCFLAARRSAMTSRGPGEG